jgi:universal stress protein E
VTQFHRLLVGLDLMPDESRVTPGSRQSALRARWLVEKAGSTVTFLHSTYDELRREPGATSGPEQPSGKGRAALEEVVREAAPGASLRCVRGRPVLEIVRHAMREGTDVVIVGKRGESDRDGRRLGAVAAKLLRKCPVPVWVVHPETNLALRRVLAATDLTPIGSLATRLAAQVAELAGAELHVVHAYQIPMALQLESSRMSAADRVAAHQAIEDRVRRAILEGLGEHRGEARLHLGATSPSLGIRQAVERVDADLLVMGTLSRGGVAGLLMGNTAERMLHRVPCSLLTIKPDDFVSPIELD